MITLIGSCRIAGLEKLTQTNYLNRISFPHSTKEIIQFINFLKGENKLPYPYNIYGLRGAVVNGNNGGYDINKIRTIEFSYFMTRLLEESETIVIEISSNRVIELDGYQIHHLLFQDKEYDSARLKSASVRYQDYDEIRDDILEIRNMLSDKHVIFVTHVNAVKNGQRFKRRDFLINSVIDICKQCGFDYYNPTELVEFFDQQEVMLEDLGHYTQRGEEIISNSLYNFIQKTTKK